MECSADRPSDVYTHVSLAVEEEVNRVAEEGHPVASLLVGKILRKIVKQTGVWRDLCRSQRPD